LNDFNVENTKKGTKDEFLIPQLIDDGKLWNKIKFIKIFTFHSGLTLPELFIILNDHLPGVYDLKSYDQNKIYTVSFLSLKIYLKIFR
jgi:hypothetical protein